MNRHRTVIVAILFFIVLVNQNSTVHAQRVYAANSVLAQGEWYKIATKNAGVYKIDIAFLNSVGMNTTNLNSSTIAIFSGANKVLPEDCTSQVIDDLTENAIFVNDGNDGIFNGNDYLLFYASDVNYWEKDSINNSFKHVINFYSNNNYFYITTKPNAKRITNAVQPSVANFQTDEYQFRYAMEEETTNLINSGKQWVGQQFSQLPGFALTKSYPVLVENKLPNANLTVKAVVAARGGSASSFNISVNGVGNQTVSVPPVSGNVLDVYAQMSAFTGNYTSTSVNANVNFSYLPNAATTQGWLDYFEVFTKCKIKIADQKQLIFNDWATVASNRITQFSIQALATKIPTVWEITNNQFPINNILTQSNDIYSFINGTSYLKEYILFYENAAITPIFIEKVINQNLHASSPLDYLIITHPTFLTVANKIADFHRSNGIVVKVVGIKEIYNEFGGGQPDISAIRNFCKMYFDKFQLTAKPLKNLLLLGDASYDYSNRITNNTNYLPTWQSESSFHPLTSYMTDDYYGYLSDQDDINNNLAPNLLDIGIGRLPINTIAEGETYLQKMLDYNSNTAKGAWRNDLHFIADDEDGNLHLNDAEQIQQTAAAANEAFLNKKIYLDTYQQISTSAGSRYPLVNNAINNAVNAGSLIVNYNGHGGNTRLGDEAILDLDMVNSWSNKFKLPLFITATCDFAAFDQPQLKSIGESLLLRSNGGAIALMTTTRVVFAYSNRIINDNYLRIALAKNANGSYKNLGEANKDAKNYTIQNSGDAVNNRKFTLLGDPYLTLTYPKYNVVTKKVNGRNYTTIADTILANKTIKIEGEVLTANGTFANNLNGIVNIAILDKPVLVNTLANDATSVRTSINTEGNILFKGSATVQNGRFSIDFIAPKDLQVAYGLGSILYYFYNDTLDGNGRNRLMIGGVSNLNSTDPNGPSIKAYLNDTKFINGGLTNQNPLLVVLLADSSGINQSGVGIGHDITAVLDNDNNNVIVLNDFYQADINDYKKGKIRYQLPKLLPGNHSITIKVWDVFNNSSSLTLDFVVGDDGRFEVNRFFNYPNPFTTKTSFWWEHNKPTEEISVQVDILTVSGKLVKQLIGQTSSMGNLNCELVWDGLDTYGNRVATGVYVVVAKFKTASGQKIIKIEKIFKI